MKFNIPSRILIYFVGLSFLDTLTTWLAINHFDAIELNPHSEATSLFSLFYQEFWGFMVISIVIYPTFHLSQKTLAKHLVSGNYEKTIKTLMSHKIGISWFILVFIFCLSLVRALPTLSNTTYILIGWSPLQSLTLLIQNYIHVSPSISFAILYGSCFAFVYNYASRKIFNWLSSSTP